MKLAEFLTIEGRESLAKELTKEGLFELEKVRQSGQKSVLTQSFRPNFAATRCFPWTRGASCGCSC